MSDNVNNPAHYQFDNGVEVIDLTEQMNFNLGNVIKYVARAGRKTDDPIEDLRKAQFYLDREIGRATKQSRGRLPEGLYKSTAAVFLDAAGDEWRWNITQWEYFDSFDNKWIAVVGPPSDNYGPFKEKKYV